MNLRKTGPAALLAALLLCGPAGCGGGDDGAAPGAAPPATASVYLTDAPPVTVTDQTGTAVFEMRELWLTITSANLEDTGGNDAPLQLARSGPVDIMTLDNTSVLFAIGTFPAGNYEEVEFQVTQALMVGDDLTSGSPVPASISLQLGSGEFEAEFQPGPVLLDPSSPRSLLVDWQPAASAISNPTAGTVTYTLEDEVDAFVAGSAGAPPTVDVDDLEGVLVGVDCPSGMLTLERGGIPILVQTDAMTEFLDEMGAPLLGGCGALATGGEVEIQGTLQPSGVVLARRVQDEDAGDVEVDGRVQAVVSGPLPEFDLRVGTTVVAHVITDPNTEFEFDDHHPNAGQPVMPATDIVDGVTVEVEGTIVGGGNVPTVLAEEVEIK